MKFHAIFKYNVRVQDLISSIDKMDFQPKSTEQRLFLEKRVRSSKIIITIFMAACVLTCAFWGIYPFLEEDGTNLPLAGWFPFDTNASPRFEIAFVYQIFAGTVNGLTNINIDTLMSGE